VACLCADADNFHHPKTKTLGLASFLAKKKNRLRGGKRLFLLARMLAKQKVFDLG
jgi:hypothetical protein